MGLPFAKKSLGQHWLTDKDSLEAMCEAAAVGHEDTVLEIGPGLGTLTELLVERAGQVIAVEFDAKLADELPSRVPADNLEVIAQDILSFDFIQLAPGYKVVANIPYYLTSNLVRVLSESANPPAMAVLLVQKEVAERIAARPGKLSILGITSQYFWDVSLDREVPARLFSPPPKVDSQIVVLSRKANLPPLDTNLYFRLVKAGFAQKRKTLANSLSGGLRISREQATALLEHAGIQPTARAQTLSLGDWQKLYETFQDSPSLHT
jgi:16S rRNA (adenine1518-N6/adenine1519-N6)-dimethyltransferase